MSFDDIFGGGESIDHQEPSNFLATPETSPVRVSVSRKEVELLKEVEEYKALVEQLTQMGYSAEEKVLALLSAGSIRR
jgi:hypothetical protein